MKDTLIDSKAISDAMSVQNSQDSSDEQEAGPVSTACTDSVHYNDNYDSQKDLVEPKTLKKLRKKRKLKFSMLNSCNLN